MELAFEEKNPEHFAGRSKVSILLVVELAFEGSRITSLPFFTLVSILLVVELAFEEDKAGPIEVQGAVFQSFL